MTTYKAFAASSATVQRGAFHAAPARAADAVRALCQGVRDIGRAAAIEIALKGGQMGSDRYFASVAAGRPLS